MYTMDSYKEFQAYQELYRLNAIKDKDLLIKIDCMLPYFLQIDSNIFTLDHLLYDERVIDFFEEQKALLCPLCGYALNQDDFSNGCFNCKHCNTLFNPLDENSNSTITSYLYNTIKSKKSQEKNQILAKKSQKNIEVSTKQLQSKDLENQESLSSDEITLPTYLHLNKRTKKENRYLYDVTIIEHLAKAPKGAYICPICDSGLGENKSGALHFYTKGSNFYCFSCQCTLSPIDKATSEAVALQLHEVTDIAKQEQKDAFQDNIDNFYNQLQQEDLALSNQEKLAIIEQTFSNRGYSSEAIDYVLHSDNFLVADDDVITKYKRLYVSIYDTNLQDKIGFQKLAYSDEKGLAKYYVKGGSLGFTLLSNPNYPNCCFIVESVANALAIYDCGYNALCCYTKGEEQPYKAYQFALQNGLKPILFLDRDVLSIDTKYIAINWLVNIEPFIGALKLKRNADASDLLVLERQFLCDLLKNAYITYYKKECYTQATLEEAFQSESKVTVIQAQVGNGKTTLAITKYKKALNPLYSVYTKDATDEVGFRLEEELNIQANVVNSDSPIITEDRHGVVTTHERLSKTTQLEDYAIYGEQPYDVAYIDEMHKFFIEKSQTIAQPYYTTDSKEEVKDYVTIKNNETMTKYVKDGLDVQVIAYKQNDDKQAVNPIIMPKYVSSTDVNKLQDIYLDRKYPLRELLDPINWDRIEDGTTNIMSKKIDSNLAYWLSEYVINASLKEMLSYKYDEIKEKLKVKHPKCFQSIRNICLPLALAFFRNCYLLCAFPIRKSDKKALSFDEWKEDIQRNIEIESNNNHSIYYKIELRYVNYQPLTNILNRVQKVFLFGASNFTYKNSLIEEFVDCFSDDFKYFNLAPCGKKELETSLLKLKKIEDKDIYKILKEVANLDCNAVFVAPKIERTKVLYKLLKQHKINEYTFFGEDCFTSFFSDSVDYKTTDSKAKEKPFKNIVVYANAPILESSNKLEDYTLMLLDCNIFKPTIEYANPYLQDLGMNIIEQLKTKLIQTIGRLYRQKGHRIVIVLLNHTSVEFDIVSFLKEKSEVVNVYEDSNNFTYYKDPKSFVENIQRALNGEKMTKFKVVKEKKKAEERKERKEQKQQERQEKKQVIALEMVASGATKRDVQRATHDYEEHTEQEKLIYYKHLNFETHKPKGASPFNDIILNSPYVTYDTEVFPNKFIICFHDFLKNSYYKVFDKENLDYNWLCHFKELPLIGFNNANYDNPILLKALNLLHPDYVLVRKENYDFNSDLKAFSNSIIEDKEHARKLWQFRKRAYAIGIGDAREMIAKNIGKEDESLKGFMLDLGLSIKETPYSFDTVLTEEQTQEVIDYCNNDSLTVSLIIDRYKGDFQTSKQIAEQAGLNGNYPKISLVGEIIYNKELTKKQREQYNPLTLDVLTSKYPNFKYNPGIDGKEQYVNEYEDYKYLLGEGGFNLLPENVLKKDSNGNWQPIETNNGLYYDVTSLDIDSMHPNSAKNIVYFGKYTINYEAILKLKETCSSDKGFKYIKAELAKQGYEVNSEAEVKERKALFKLILNSTYGNTHIKDKKTNKVKPSILCKCEHNLIALCGSAYSSTLHHTLIKDFQGISIVQMKTDSIKIANCTEDNINSCNKIANDYGYTYKVEDVFKYILCKGNEYIAIKIDNTLDVKGSTFKDLLFDDRGVLRNKNDLRSLLVKRKSKSIYKLGTKEQVAKGKTTYKYVMDVNSQKVQYFLPMKEEYKDGLYPYYVNKNGTKCGVKDFTSQKVVAIYDLKELDSIDKSMIDYDFFQSNVLKALDIMLDTILEKREPLLKDKLDKQNFENRIRTKQLYLNEKELYFFNTVKSQIAFV